MKCVVCGKPRRYITREKPCCRKCERTAPICVSAPLLFADEHRTPATLVARAVLEREE